MDEAGAMSGPPWRWLGLIAALGFNLVPLIGVAAWGWSAFALIFLYWLENLAVGARTLASMVASGIAQGRAGIIAAAIFGAFFCFHYGMFSFVHGVFVIATFGGSETDGAHVADMFDLVGAARALLGAYPNLALGFVSIGLWQGLLFVLFLVRGEAGRSNPLALMASPYPRIVVLHIAIIGGGFLVLAAGQPLGGLIALTLMKCAFDVAQALGWGGFAARDQRWDKFRSALERQGAKTD